METDEPVTPAGRLFLQEDMNTVINCFFGFKHPIDEETIKTEMKNSIMLQHPRFRSLLVKDSKGREYWETRNDLDIDKHVFTVKDIERIYGHGEEDCKNDDESSKIMQLVNSYLADLSVSTPLDTDKPLWEFHLLKEQKCAVLRVHHALGDGISLMSLFLGMCRKVDHPDQLPTIPNSSSTNKNNSIREKIWKFLIAILWTLVYAMELMLRTLFLKDAETKLSGGSGVELWPRKAATARFKLDDMKTVKNAAMPNTTINDVLFGVVSAGLSRYLDYHQPSNSRAQERLRITGLAMVNLRKQPGLQDMAELVRNTGNESVSSWWGNKIGFIMLPLYHHNKNVDSDPLQYVKRAKAMLDKKKLSLEAHFSYALGNLVMTLLGPKASMLLNYRFVCNTSFMISNVVGRQEEIMFAGNPITSIRLSPTSLPHALTMIMASYAGVAEMQILVAKDIIPDPLFLAKCFEDALLEMKAASIYT